MQTSDPRRHIFERPRKWYSYPLGKEESNIVKDSQALLLHTVVSSPPFAQPCA